MTNAQRNPGWAAVMVVVTLLVLAGATAAHAQTFSVLYTFANVSGGWNPQAGLIADSAGNLYGTAEYGGSLSSPCGRDGAGVVYKLSPTGQETVLHTFTGVDGCFPFTSLLQDAAGNLYGTTTGGGNTYHGTAFKLNPAGTEVVLHSFTNGKDGSDPEGNLISDRAGNLYGTTTGGGLYGHAGCGGGCGVVYELNSTGKEMVLHSFTGVDGVDGSNPVGGLIRDPAGNLYGTTATGGVAGIGGLGYGTVYKLDPAGKETILHSFTDGADGAFPAAGLVRDAAGNLYGTTPRGGSVGDFGVVFKVTLP